MKKKSSKTKESPAASMEAALLAAHIAPPRRAAAATAQAISEAQQVSSGMLHLLLTFYFESLIFFPQVYESTELPPEYKRNKAGQIEMLGDR